MEDGDCKAEDRRMWAQLIGGQEWMEEDGGL